MGITSVQQRCEAAMAMVTYTTTQKRIEAFQLAMLALCNQGHRDRYKLKYRFMRKPLHMKQLRQMLIAVEPLPEWPIELQQQINNIRTRYRNKLKRTKFRLYKRVIRKLVVECKCTTLAWSIDPTGKLTGAEPDFTYYQYPWESIKEEQNKGTTS